MKRASGVLLPIFSLPGKYGIGTLGAGARCFIDRIAESGFSVWQTLPFCPTDAYGSPYAGTSSFAASPCYIDPGELLAAELITEKEYVDEERPEGRFAEGDLLDTRLALCKKAATHLDGGVLDDFLDREPKIADYCRLYAERGGDFEAVAFSQYEFFRQWDALREYAHGHGVSLMGDMPIYVSAESLDLSMYPEAFLLDGEGHAERVAGVPPDYFSADGQVWGNPLYRYTDMAADGYAYIRDRLSFLTRHFDALRLDHFRGYLSYYSIPAGASAREGRWENGPGDSLFEALPDLIAGYPIIAEDLGNIGADVDAFRRRCGFLSTRVFQFGFLGDPQSVHLPHNYPADSVAYSGTHDNETLQEYLLSMPDIERSYLLNYCGAQGGGDTASAVVRTLLASHASLAIFPLADLLGLGAPFRINTPGRAEGNWSVRFLSNELNALDTEHNLYLNRLFGRTGN